MLSPTTRLLWITLLLAVPVLALGGINTSFLPFVVLFLLIIVAILAFDMRRLSTLLEEVAISAVDTVSAYKDRLNSLRTVLRLPTGLADVQFALELPPSFEVTEPVAVAYESTTVSIAFTPISRGEFVIRTAYVSALSPWGLWRMRIQRSMELAVQVYPDLTKDPALRKLFFTFQQGQRVQRIVGRGREVERLREYAVGDSFDEVYWKGTARRGSPITKVFQVESTQDIYAIVDGSRLGNRNQALERFVSASLLLAIAAEKNADNFGLLSFSDRIQHFVRASHGKGHFHRYREAIYDLQPSLVSPDFGELFTFINLRIRKRALLFFLTDLSDPLVAEMFSRDASMIARRHVTMVNQIADAGDRPLFTGSLPVNNLEVQGRLAGHLQWAKLRELEKSLSHIGVHMHLLRPEQASAELLGQYMTIKQRQLL